MDWITDSIAIGDYEDAQGDRPKKAGITAVLNVCFEREDFPPHREYGVGFDGETYFCTHEYITDRDGCQEGEAPGPERPGREGRIRRPKRRREERALTPPPPLNAPGTRAQGRSQSPRHLLEGDDEGVQSRF